MPIVNGAIVYDSPYIGNSYVLLTHNAIHATSMEYNLVLPLIIREAVIIANDTPKIYAESSTLQ